jgi:hypothetical protein
MNHQIKLGAVGITRGTISRRLIGRILLLAGVVCLSTMGMSEAQEAANAAALTQLRGLAGDWEGPLEWSGARTGTGRVNATYYETGNGSAVVENLVMGGDVPSMTSVYHLDGADLRMTHFCAESTSPKSSPDRPCEGCLGFRFRGCDQSPVTGRPARLRP